MSSNKKPDERAKEKEKDTQKERDKEREAKRKREAASNSNIKEKEKREENEQKKKQILSLLEEVPKVNLLKKESDFSVKMKFRNSLPDIPLDPKLLKYPFDPQRYVKYIPSSLEKNYKQVILHEPDLGNPINLIDPEQYKHRSSVQLSPEDELLVNPPAKDNTLLLKYTSRGPFANGYFSRHGLPSSHGKEISNTTRAVSALADKHGMTMPTSSRPYTLAWLSSNQPTYQRKPKEDLHARLFKEKNKDNQDRVPERQAKLVEETFEVAKQPPIHPTNPDLKPVEILPVFPDFSLWANRYTQVLFDSDPLPSEEVSRKRADDGVLKAFSSAEKKWMVYVLPPKNSVSKKRKVNGEVHKEEKTQEGNLFGSDEEMEEVKKPSEHTEEGDDENENDRVYDRVKDYTYEFKSKLEDLFCFVFTPESVSYNPIRNRLSLQKIKGKAGTEVFRVKRRPATEDELKAREENFSELAHETPLPEIAESP